MGRRSATNSSSALMAPAPPMHATKASGPMPAPARSKRAATVCRTCATAAGGLTASPVVRHPEWIVATGLRVPNGLGIGPAGGALIAGVVRGGPAEEGGIRPGDVVVATAGTALKPGQRVRAVPAARSGG